MKKYLAILFAAMLCLGCLGLAACGGSNSDSSSSAGSDEQAATAPDEGAATDEGAASADPAAKFVGTWLLSAAEMNGVTMAGDFSQYVGMDNGGVLILNADGTGSINLGEGRENGDLAWAVTGDDAATITVNGTDTPLAYKDGAVFMTFSQDGQTATIVFTQDGVYTDAKVVSAADGKPITSEADLLGTWNLTGLSMGGISIYGDAEALAGFMGGDDSGSYITFEEGGVAKMSTEDGTWAVDANGATLTTKFFTEEVTCPVLMVGDDIAIDLTEAASGTEFILLMSK